MIVDTALPSRDFLLSPDAVELLELVIGEAGGTCRSARAAQVRYVPGSSITVQYEATVGWEDQPDSVETLVAVAGLDTPPGTVVVEVNETPVSVWRYPNDPFLPGLRIAADARGARRVLDQLDVPGGELRVRRRTYRPGRRAVIQLTTNGTRVFLKVVRPSTVTRLQRIHEMMSAHVLVPRSHGWSEEMGMVTLQAMPGQTLRSAVAGGASEVPSGRELAGLLETLPDLPDGFRSVQGHVARLAFHVSLLAAVHPSLEARLSRLAGSISVVEQPKTTVHGDFHTSQVMVEGSRIIGLIDVDSTGLGERADDFATMLGQVSVLTLGPDRAAFADFGGSLVAEFDRIVDPADLRNRVAAAVLGFATGPFRVQSPDWRAETEARVTLAEQWLESAG